MIDQHDELYKDFEAVKNIPVVHTMLDVVCRLTGMGFAAVARVTDNRWLACSVNDTVNFGLGEGGELQIETTLCNEIRGHHKEIVIDNVDLDECYKDHHTPKMYGLKSYISYPIMLKNGDFFGTLCAIDANPHIVSTPEILGTFKLFAELLAFHLDSIDLITRSQSALQESNKSLTQTTTENQLYKQITAHNIKEQVRKIAFFSDVLANNTDASDIEKIKTTASKINSISLELGSMIQHVTKFSKMESLDGPFQATDLNLVLQNVRNELATELAQKNINITCSLLPTIAGVAPQLHELFFQLISHAVMFAKSEHRTSIKIFTGDILTSLFSENGTPKLCEVVVEQYGVGLEESRLKNVFDIFLHLNDKQSAMRYGAGLAYCRKIVQYHGGTITAKPLPDKGISFSIVLPVEIAHHIPAEIAN